MECTRTVTSLEFPDILCCPACEIVGTRHVIGLCKAADKEDAPAETAAKEDNTPLHRLIGVLKIQEEEELILMEELAKESMASNGEVSENERLLLKRLTVARARVHATRNAVCAVRGKHSTKELGQSCIFCGKSSYKGEL